MVGLSTYVLEAFTAENNKAFSGNPAGICVLKFDDDISAEQKQNIASQMNVSVTAFLSQGWTNSKPLNSLTSNRWTLRWFTPLLEIEICGHATLAAANVIYNEILKKTKPLLVEKDQESITFMFESKTKGELEAIVNVSTGLITLNFPSNPAIPLLSESEKWIPEMITNVLGSNNIPSNTVDDIKFASGIGYLLFRLKNTGDAIENAKVLLQLSPNFTQLTKINTGELKLKGIIVTAQGTAEDLEKPQFFSRFFGPWLGIDEDQSTGSSHTVLAPYWLEEFRKQGIQLKSETILGKQLSTRGGQIYCSMRGENRVNIIGQIRLALKGEFYPA